MPCDVWSVLIGLPTDMFFRMIKLFAEKTESMERKVRGRRNWDFFLVMKVQNINYLVESIESEPCAGAEELPGGGGLGSGLLCVGLMN